MTVENRAPLVEREFPSMSTSKCTQPDSRPSKSPSRSLDRGRAPGTVQNVNEVGVRAADGKKSVKRAYQKDNNGACKEVPKCNTNTAARTGKRYSTHGVQDRPLKRRRLWCETVTLRALANGVETDAHRISQRQKQIDFGKNTPAYDRFNKLCPRPLRRFGDPMTPLPNQKCSKRSFAGQITSWKKRVYEYVAKLDEKEKDRNTAQGKDCPTSNATKVKERSCVSKDDASIKKPVNEEKEIKDNSNQTDPKSTQQEPFTAPSSTATTSVEASADEATRDEPRSCDDDVDVNMMDVDMFSDYSDMEDIELDDQGNVVACATSCGDPESDKGVTQTSDQEAEADSHVGEWNVFKPF